MTDNLKLSRASSVKRAGLYSMTAEAYHADPCPAPALSASLSKIIVARSARHALAACPRLSARRDAPTYHMEQGSAVHAYLAGQDDDVAVIPFADWRSDDARRLRGVAWRNGQAAILKTDMERLRAAADHARPIVAELLGKRAALHEPVICWQNQISGCWRRAMLDVVSTDGRVVIDLKTRDGDASPRSAARALMEEDAQIQQAFYLAALDAVQPRLARQRTFFFVSIERTPPFGVSVHELDGAAIGLGAEQIALAMREWDAAITQPDFASAPIAAGAAYPAGPHLVETPPWKLSAWHDRQFAGTPGGGLIEGSPS